MAIRDTVENDINEEQLTLSVSRRLNVHLLLGRRLVADFDAASLQLASRGGRRRAVRRRRADRRLLHGRRQLQFRIRCAR